MQGDSSEGEMESRMDTGSGRRSDGERKNKSDATSLEARQTVVHSTPANESGRLDVQQENTEQWRRSRSSAPQELTRSTELSDSGSAYNVSRHSIPAETEPKVEWVDIASSNIAVNTIPRPETGLSHLEPVSELKPKDGDEAHGCRYVDK